MGDKSRGLYEKFKVERTDGTSAPGGKHEGCQYFTLDIGCDPYAIPALLAYYEACKAEYPRLGIDILARVRMHCEHEWTETLHGPDTVGEHCMNCGAEREYDDYDYGLEP